MDYNQMQWMRMQQMQGVPFYMAYPMQNVYMTEMEYERDRERMNQLYPKEAKELQKYVEDECDKLEYEGSMMFDEYPDRIMLKMICDRIYQEYMSENTPAKGKVEKEIEIEMKIGETEEKEMKGMQVGASDCRSCPQDRPPMGPGRPPHRPGHPPMGPGRPPQDRPPMGSGRPPHRPGRPPQNDSGLNNLIEVLLYNEMYKRRCRHKRCRQWW